jgi:hypothetical protein
MRNRAGTAIRIKAMNSKDRLYFIAGLIWLAAALLAAGAAALGATDGTGDASSTNAVTIPAGSNIGAIQLAIDEAKPGATINFAPGSYNLNASIDVPSGDTLQGASYTNTHLTFTLPPSQYAFEIAANASNVTIKSFDVVSNYGFVYLGAGNGYSNISILGNAAQVGLNSQQGAGIEASVPCNNLAIEYNYFHDGPLGTRTIYLWSPTNSHVDYNLFCNVWDCCQGNATSNTGDVFDYSYNYGTSIINKGLEFQSQYENSSGGFKANGNVFYDWKNPNGQTFGLSIPVIAGSNSVAENNYLAATSAPGSAPVNDHFGYGIEFGSTNGVCSGNIMVGAWGADFGYASNNVKFNNNRIFGQPFTPGNYYSEEPGSNPTAVVGSGSLANAIDQNVNDAPAPPANTFAGPQFMQAAAGTQPTSAQSAVPGSSGSIAAGSTASIQPSFDLTVAPNAADTTDGTATISWSGLPAAATEVKINTIATVGRQTGATVAPTAVIYPASPATVTMDQCHTGWQIDFEADAVDANGNVLASSNVATVQFPGNSLINPPYATTPTGPQAQASPTLALPTTMPITLEGTLTINAQGQPSLTLHN